jgi:UDP-N-acetylglucosamine 4,6-dehydratase
MTVSTDYRTFEVPAPDLDDRSVLVTGGTGSFGRRFIPLALARSRPGRLIVFSRDELKQYEMAQELSEDDAPCLRYFIGDVRDRDRLEMAMRGVDYVVHAAALKQVPAAEYNPFECIHTNVLGAENVVHAALRAGVKRVIALSTDKAVSPLNLYGASKLAAEKIFVAANNLSAGVGTRFAVVRYGNVIDSRGSVVPLFRKMISEGADSLPITDPRMGHLDPGRELRPLFAGHDAGRRDLRAQDPEHEGRRSRHGHGAQAGATHHRYPAGREDP